jgi:hypothetical protein
VRSGRPIKSLRSPAGDWSSAGQYKSKPPSLEHLEIWGNEHGDGHVVSHHFDDGSIEHYEFAHPHENPDALSHLATHMNMDHNLGGQQEEDEV